VSKFSVVIMGVGDGAFDWSGMLEVRVTLCLGGGESVVEGWSDLGVMYGMRRDGSGCTG